jgi:threonine dehydratase
MNKPVKFGALKKSWAAAARRSARNHLGCPLRLPQGKRAPLIRRNVDDIVTVSEEAIISAMRLVWEKLKAVIEPSSAVPVAAVLEKKVPVAGKSVAIILSGGNVDLDHLPWRATP